ncbi:extracellular solute-binding protein [Caballeronia arvi]|uniref:Extracellular solute-binding protein n=1 Tax=Caballeronia arvi TaxID=1777135 RepID=A0A158JXG8_9BURK|nr:transporter substrate-binding domain-containing protein [Caballeronia arvi]SAL73508.1 extracellular solute-binding protein [Caballeronia arvi]
MKRWLSTSFAIAVACTGALPVLAHADPVWDRIKSSGHLVCGAIPNDPIGSWVDPKTGKWEGYEIELCRSIASDLSTTMGKKIEPEFHETGWNTVVLDIQSQKIDIWPGMSATPERKNALSMVGPIYTLAMCGMVRPNFQTKSTWADLNRSDVRIATVTGTSVETAFKKTAPEATQITLAGYSEITLAVQSGRADMMGADVLRCLNVAKSAPAAFGGIVYPKPIQSLGSSAGVLKSADQFTAWLQKWSDEKRKSGDIKKMFMSVFEKTGLDPSKVPPEIQF